MKFALPLILLVLCSVTALAQTGLKIGAEAPVFSAASMQGDCYDLNELRGSVVVLTFWSTRCEICRHEFPKLNTMIDGYKDQKVVFLSLTTEDETRVEQYLRANRMTSRVLPNSFGVLLQYADRDRQGNINFGFPAYFVIDQTGVLQYRASGFDKTQPLNTAINRLVAR